jgi:serine/arginine repetitive matrix protein 2
MDGSMQSSPDPLNASQSFHHSPPKARRAPRVRTSLPLQGSSPKKQTFELDVGNQLSPQKIRVTVEAGESDVENTYATYADYNDGDDVSPTLGPVSRRRERTTTTTIPLKGLSDSEEEVTQSVATPKRGRGRPRKTAGTPVPAKKKPGRSSTPTQRTGRRKSVGDLVDGDDEEDINFELGKSVEVNRGKKGSRSRSRKGTKPTPAPQTQNAANEPSISVPKRRGRRKSLPPAEVDVLEDESNSSNTDRHRGSELPTSMETIDSNGRYSVSPDPIIRSMTSRGVGEPDVVIARFDPGNETPHRTGWSSPRVFEAQPSGSRCRSDNYPSPSLSPDKMTFDLPDKEVMAGGAHEPSDEDNYEDEALDGVGEMREFDTILESEGFSMISVDSVPSLREHLSSPVERPGMSGKKPLVMKSFRTVQEADASAYNDSFSEIPEEILAAATPAKEAQNPKLLSVQAARVDDSFSNSISSQPPMSDRISPARAQCDEVYDDSFSVIPPEILDAATPAAVCQQRPAVTTQGLPVPRSATSPLATRSPSGSRLLTPDKSPSPPPTSSKAQTEVNGQASTSRSATRDLPADESSFMHSHLPSSPPMIEPRRYTYTAHLRQHRQFNSSVVQTPSIVFSSPSLPPPPIQMAKGNPTLAPTSEHSDRPALSSIARAGRMLQNIVVPSSPRSRSQSLGSPFKSPAAEKRSSSIMDQSQVQSSVFERRVGPLPQLDLSSQLSASSAQQQRDNRQHEDPFRSSGSRTQRSPSLEEQQEYSLEVPQGHRYSDPRLSSLRSKSASVRSDNDMSWQAEQEISVPEPTSLTDRFPSEHKAMTAEERWSADRAEVIKLVEFADTDRLIVIDSDDEKLDHSEADDDEGFGQLLETLNSSSPVVPKAQELVRDFGEKPRRSKIPSPWRKNSKRLVYSDELTHISSPPIAEKDAVAARLAKDTIPQPVTVRRISDPELSFEGDSAEFSGWQIPQKSNFNPRPRENYTADLSALFTASPPKRLPVLTKATQQPFVQQETSSKKSAASEVPQKVENVHDRTSGFAPIPQKSGFNPRPRAGLSSPVKQPAFGQNLFAGNSRGTEVNTPLEPSSSSSASRPLTASSPSRTNTLHAFRTPSAQVSTLNSDQESSLLSTSDKENQITNSRTLKWTETLQLQSTRTFVQTPLLTTTSPVKSCLRSPMKTPSGHATTFENTSPSKAVAFVSSSPMPSSPSNPLSSTTWSKDHWRVLDTILQQWKPENQNFSPLSSDGSAGKEKRRRNSTRVISKLLGKTVVSKGQKLVLEQWHLEVVDEFRGTVPGWEEKAVAMRVFSLLIGEEKRVLKMQLAAQNVGC